MIIGALIASGDDLTFNWFGYTFLTVNNLSTTAQGIVMKQKLVNKVNSDSSVKLREQCFDLFRISIKMVFSFIIHLSFSYH